MEQPGWWMKISPVRWAAARQDHLLVSDDTTNPKRSGATLGLEELALSGKDSSQDVRFEYCLD